MRDLRVSLGELVGAEGRKRLPPPLPLAIAREQVFNCSGGRPRPPEQLIFGKKRQARTALLRINLDDGVVARRRAPGLVVIVPDIRDRREGLEALLVGAIIVADKSDERSLPLADLLVAIPTGVPSKSPPQETIWKSFRPGKGFQRRGRYHGHIAHRGSWWVVMRVTS